MHDTNVAADYMHIDSHDRAMQHMRENYQAALAEKERELAKAREYVRRSERDWLEATDQVLKLRADLDQVVREAVKFAELYTNAGVRKRFLCFNEHYHEAMCFLTSPQVQAWRKGKEGKG